MPTTLTTAPRPPKAPPLADLHTEQACGDCGHTVPTWRDPHGGEYFCLPCLQAYIAWEKAEVVKASAALVQLTQFQRQRAA